MVANEIVKCSSIMVMENIYNTQLCFKNKIISYFDMPKHVVLLYHTPICIYKYNLKLPKWLLFDFSKCNNIHLQFNNNNIAGVQCLPCVDYNNYPYLTRIKINSFMNTLPKMNVFNITHLDCSHTHIHYIPEDLNNLIHLNCFKSKVTHIPNTLIHLKELYCNDEVENIPDTLTQLELLNITHSKIHCLPNTLTQLKYLNIKNTFINYIPNTFIHLKELRCGTTLISHIPETITQLEYLDMSYECNMFNTLNIPYTHIQNLYNIASINCNSLKTLNVSRTHLQNIPHTLTQLEYLDVSLTDAVIPKSLTQLKILNCQFSDVYTIPDTLTQLTCLYCNSSMVEKLPKTLIKLTHIDISGSLITHIPNTYTLLTCACCDEDVKIPKNLNIKKCNSINLCFNCCHEYSHKNRKNNIPF